jgi:hypothetical protein
MQMDMHTATPSNLLPDFFNSESCMDDIHQLFTHSEQTLAKEGVLDQLIKFEDWLGASNRNRGAAYRVANDGLACLHKTRNCLSQRVDDLIRLEGEGGLPATPAQEAEIAELSHTVKRIDHMIDLIEGKQLS